MRTISTRYTSHPGSNVGRILATTTARGIRESASVRYNQAWSSRENHEAAADLLATRIGEQLATTPDREYNHTSTIGSGTTGWAWRLL